VRLQAGDRVPVHVDGLDEPLEGRVRFVSNDPAFTPFFALTEHDRSRLSFLAEIDLPGGEGRVLPAGVPVQVAFPDE
jgi:HlyD family secretion protein